jgi:type IV secretory pathway VirB10-like protein
MVKNMKIDLKIIEELQRHNQINSYITEQEVALPPAPGGEPGGESPLPPPPADATAGATPPTPPPAPAETSAPVNTETDPDVEKLDDEGKSEEKKEKGKELEITDLVKSQKNIEDKQEEYFENLFQQINDLETKLSNMDNIVNKLNDLESKIEKYRERTPQEKLELRSLDSGPFNQKLSQFFEDKEEDMEKTGKNEYVLTQKDIEDYSPIDIKKSFRDFGDENIGEYVR